MTLLGRLSLLPLIVVYCAVSFVRNLSTEVRYTKALGFLDPAMDVHWIRLENWRAEGDFDHVAKNILSEWARLDPQRAVKTFSFLLCCLFFMFIVAIILY